MSSEADSQSRGLRTTLTKDPMTGDAFRVYIEKVLVGRPKRATRSTTKIAEKPEDFHRRRFHQRNFLERAGEVTLLEQPGSTLAMLVNFGMRLFQCCESWVTAHFARPVAIIPLA